MQVLPVPGDVPRHHLEQVEQDEREQQLAVARPVVDVRVVCQRGADAREGGAVAVARGGEVGGGVGARVGVGEGDGGEGGEERGVQRVAGPLGREGREERAGLRAEGVVWRGE